MSALLERARQNIGTDQGLSRVREFDAEQLSAERERIEKINILELGSEMRLKAIDLFNGYAAIVPSYRGIEKVKAILGHRTQGRMLSTMLDGDEEKPVVVRMDAWKADPAKGKILIIVQGLTPILELSQGGPVLHEEGFSTTFHEERKGLYDSPETYDFAEYLRRNRKPDNVGNISLKELTEYRDILNMVEQKLNPATKPPSPSHPTT